MFEPWTNFSAGVKFGVLALVCTLGMSIVAASASWSKKSSTDRLGGKTIIEMRTNGRGAIHQFGHTVASQLVMACTHPDGGTDYVSVELYFSERVAISIAHGRYRFDDAEVVPVNLLPSDSGNYLVLASIFSEKFFVRLRNSSKLRVEVSLPWAGNPILEFDTSGAGAAMDEVPCKPHH